MRHKILIIAQDQELYCEIENTLKNVSLELHHAKTYQEAFNRISRFHYVMVIMDFGVSELNGVEVVRRLRQLEQMPILVLSGHATRMEEIQTLNAGADQYLPIDKPLDTERCLANAMAIMRRHLSPDPQSCASTLITGNGLKINLKLRKAYLNGENLHLTPKQFALLSTLVGHMGEVVTKEELYQAAWANEYDINSDDVLKYHINQLRRKLGLYGIDGLIETSWGVGYQFNIDESE